MPLNLKAWISNKLQEFDLVNKWKGFSLVKKIICIAVALYIIAILIGLFVLFLVEYTIGTLIFIFWLAALFKPSIVKSNTRMQASKRILIPFISIFLAIGIFYQYYSLEQKPTIWEYVVGSDTEFDEKGNLIKESNLSLIDRILGNNLKLNDKGDVLKKQTHSITIYLGLDGYKGNVGLRAKNGQWIREAKKGLFSEDKVENE